MKRLRTVYEVLRQIPKEDLLKVANLFNFETDHSINHIQLAQALWIDEFGSAAATSLEGFAEDEIKKPDFPKKLWQAFLCEWYSFFCTNSKKYASLRKNIESLKGGSSTTIIATIAASLSASVGPTAGLLTPFIAILVDGAFTIGCQTACGLLKDKLKDNE